MSDFIDKKTDDFILGVGEAVESLDKKKTVVNQDKVDAVLESKNVMEQIVSGENVKVTYQVHEPFNSTGSVTVTGKEININDPEAFNIILNVASNFEVYPKLNGSVVMAFSFDGLTRKGNE